MKYVLITGVSTGIGRDAAATMIRAGWHVFGSVRKEADADRLRADFPERFTPLLFDVTDHEAIRRAVPEVAAIVGDAGLAGLINNAGIAVPGPVQHLSVDDYRRQFEVNFFGMIAVTQAFLPLLGARRDAPHPPGRIIQISSVSGQISYPFFSPYAGSKSAMEALSHGMRRELMIYGIDVIIVGPGSVRTPIWEKAAELDVSVYADTDYAPVMKDMHGTFVGRGLNGIPVERVSRIIYEALTKPKPKVRYAIASRWLTGWFLPRYLPARLLDRIVQNRLGLHRIG